jgi:trimeric autotransporter adhesin
MGYNSLAANTTGASNTAVGYQALIAQTTGANNNVLGYQGLNALTSGSNNIGIGNNTGAYLVNLTTGSGNVLIGHVTSTTASDTDYATGIGYNLSCEGGYTTLGQSGSDIRAAHGVATWATVSDERYKKDIVDSTAGLSFINALRPRTFKYRTLGELPETFSAYEEGSTEVFKNYETNHGFIAQEIKAAIDADASIKDGFRLWDDREDGSQEVAEAALIPVLVKAIQELTARLETLEGK